MRYFGRGIGHQKTAECHPTAEPNSDGDDEERDDEDAMDVDRTATVAHAGNAASDDMSTRSGSDSGSDSDTDTDTDASSENSDRYCDFGPEDDDMLDTYDVSW